MDHGQRSALSSALQLSVQIRLTQCSIGQGSIPRVKALDQRSALSPPPPRAGCRTTRARLGALIPTSIGQNFEAARPEPSAFRMTVRPARIMPKPLLWLFTETTVIKLCLGGGGPHTLSKNVSTASARPSRSVIGQLSYFMRILTVRDTIRAGQPRRASPAYSRTSANRPISESPAVALGGSSVVRALAFTPRCNFVAWTVISISASRGSHALRHGREHLRAAVFPAG